MKSKIRILFEVLTNKLSVLKEFFTTKIRDRYRLVIRNDQTLEERISVVLTPLNVIFIFSGALVVFTTLIILLFPKTPLGGLLPGGKDVNSKNMNALILRLDSLERKLRLQEEKNENLLRILQGEDASLGYPESMKPDRLKLLYSSFLGAGSAEDKVGTSLEASKTNLTVGRMKARRHHYVFFTPLKGLVADTFNSSTGHTAVDIVSYNNAAVKATLSGTVLFSAWTPETGHVMIIQHADNLVSVYKHNSTLFKKQGTVVQAGEVIALVGNTGEMSSGPHLHFELWQSGRPLNPIDYMVF